MKTVIKAGTKFLLSTLAIPVLIACGGQSDKNTKRMITVTIEPQRYFAEAIAGNKFVVTCMVPKGSSPEAYDPTPRQLVALNESEAYFRIGHIGFELSWMERLMKNAPHIRVFDLSDGVEFICEAGQDHGDHFHSGAMDPHIWNSTTNAKVIAGNVFKALCTLDTKNESYYAARYDSLSKRIDETDSMIRNMLKSDNGTGHAFMIYHPALSYFARDYGLHQICIEEGGKEPSPVRMKRLIEASEKEEVRVVFVQPEFDRRNAEIIAKQINAEIVPVNPLSYNWEEEMIHLANSLKSTRSE